MPGESDELEVLVTQFEADLDSGVDRKHVLRSAMGRGIDIGVRHATEHMNERFEKLIERVAHLETVFGEAQKRALKAELERDSILTEMKMALSRVERRLQSGEMRVHLPREEPPAGEG